MRGCTPAFYTCPAREQHLKGEELCARTCGVIYLHLKLQQLQDRSTWPWSFHDEMQNSLSSLSSTGASASKYVKKSGASSMSSCNIPSCAHVILESQRDTNYWYHGWCMATPSQKGELKSFHARRRRILLTLHITPGHGANYRCRST